MSSQKTTSSLFHELGNVNLIVTDATNDSRLCCRTYKILSLQSFMSQQRNVSHKHHQKMTLECRKQEEMRENQTKHIAKEKQLQANFQSEDRVEKKRFLRKMQDEEYGKQIEESLLKVGFILFYITSAVQKEMPDLVFVSLLGSPLSVPYC